MIIKNKYPVCEYDTSRNSIINAADFLSKTLPEKCVITLVGEIIVPVVAVRDEGTSYHYLEPSREVECHKETVETVVSCLKQMGIPFTAGKTWTSYAIYRETPDMVELRRNEGCITVEMEAAAR